MTFSGGPIPSGFLRQRVIGNYIVDFYAVAQAKLVIELDGSQHYEADAAQKDAERTDFFGAVRAAGAAVLRTMRSMANFSGVCEYIDLAVKQTAGQHCTKASLV